MPEIQKRILIVDDDIQLYLHKDNLFKNCGIEVDARIARNTATALAILDEWLGEGNHPDIISADDNRYGKGDLAENVLNVLLTYLESRGQEYLPKKFFIHSASPAQPLSLKWGEADFIHKQNFLQIAWYGDLGPDAISSSTDFSFADLKNNKIMEYCNQAWGTNFARSEATLQYRFNKQRKFSLDEIHSLVTEGTIPQQEGLKHIDPHDTPLDDISYVIADSQEHHVTFDDATGAPLIGRIAFDAQTVESLRAENPLEKIIFCTMEYDPTIVSLFSKIDGIILFGKGREHLKLVAENAGLTAIMEFEEDSERMDAIREVSISSGRLTYLSHVYDSETEKWIPEQHSLKSGDYVTLSVYTLESYGGDSQPCVHNQGELYPRRLEINTSSYTSCRGSWFTDILNWCDDARAGTGLKIEANVDSTEQVKSVIKDGGEGIGLVRTEHMFFEETRLRLLQTIMLTEDPAERQSAIQTLKELHTTDLMGLFNAAVHDGNPVPVTIRLMDAPPNEFLNDEQVERLKARVGNENTRGVQFASTTPGFYRMQLEAIFEAAAATGGQEIKIMVPLIRNAAELEAVHVTADEIAAGRRYKFGAMIETMDAVQNIGEIARLCNFVKIGSNDLMSELMGGIARNDLIRINNWMIENEIVRQNPFRHLTPPLISAIKQIVEGARKANPTIEIGACGQQMGEDFGATKLALELGLHDISVSQKFLARARVCAGHYAALKEIGSFNPCLK